MGRGHRTLLWKNQRSPWSASFRRTWINEVAAPPVISDGSSEISGFRRTALFCSYEEEDGYPDPGFLLTLLMLGIQTSSLTAIQTTLSSPSPSILNKQNMGLELSLRSFFPSPEAEIDEAAGVVAVEITSQTILSNSSTHYESQNGRGDEFMIRKKLRLSKDQSAYLEATFKHNTTLNPRLKVDLAKKLNLQTRQVEVWFQNRRARTKMKQTEVECEYLKRLCEKLMEENLKLQKEVKELKAMKSSQPISFTGFNTVSATTLTVCSSCVTTTTVADSAPSTATLATDNCDSGSTSAKHRILQQKKTRSYAISEDSNNFDFLEH